MISKTLIANLPSPKGWVRIKWNNAYKEPKNSGCSINRSYYHQHHLSNNLKHSRHGKTCIDTTGDRAGVGRSTPNLASNLYPLNTTGTPPNSCGPWGPCWASCHFCNMKGYLFTSRWSIKGNSEVDNQESNLQRKQMNITGLAINGLNGIAVKVVKTKNCVTFSSKQKSKNTWIYVLFCFELLGKITSIIPQ